MRIAPFIASACVLAAVVVAACADSDNTNDGTPILDGGSSGTSGTSGSTKADTGSCEKQTCETVDGACGDHPDGCGGTFSCGKCKDPVDACAPQTCTTLKKTCGSFEDGCGGIVGCGTCESTCPKDAKEPNDKFDGASDLGAASDYDNAEISVKGMQSSDGDEDWFKIKVTDGGLGGNPVISATVTDTTLEVSIFHVCNSKPDFSYCNGPGTQEDTVGKGCYAVATVKLNTECKGIDESGTTYIRVRKRGVDTTCHAYDLTVKVE